MNVDTATATHKAGQREYVWVRRCHKHGVITVNGCFRLQLCQCPLPSGIPKRVPPITACIWDQRQFHFGGKKGLPVPVAAGPLTSLAPAGRPRAPPFDHDHARSLSQEMDQTRRSTGANCGNEPLTYWKKNTHCPSNQLTGRVCWTNANRSKCMPRCHLPVSQYFQTSVVLDHESRHDLFHQEKSMFYPH